MTELRTLDQWRVGAFCLEQRLALQTHNATSNPTSPFATINTEDAGDMLAHRVPPHAVPPHAIPHGASDDEHAYLANARYWYDWPVDLPFNHAALDTDGHIVAIHCDIRTAKSMLADFTAANNTTNPIALPDTIQTIRDRYPAMITRPWHLIDRLASILLDDLKKFPHAWNTPHAPPSPPTLPTSSTTPPTTASAISPSIPHDNNLGTPSSTTSSDTPTHDHDSSQANHANRANVHIHPDARVLPHVVFITDNGPIVIDHHATINPFTIIQGPCYIGPHTTVAPHTQIRGPVSVGPFCVIGGEVSHSAIDAYSNKAHLGYLGHAIVGQWVNLGADTNVSNLKNTYGPVRVQLTPPPLFPPHSPPHPPSQSSPHSLPRSPLQSRKLSSDDTEPNLNFQANVDANAQAQADAGPENSQLTKLGPLIGDHVRTAIGTRIPTGSCIATASMIATSRFCPKYVPPMTFLTDDGPTPYDPPRLIQSIERMMQRRQQSLDPQHRQRLLQPFYPTCH